MMYNFFELIALSLCFIVTNGLFEDSKCMKDGVSGTCINLTQCESALREIRKKKRPQICRFQGEDPIVCCTESVQDTSTPSRPMSTTSTIKPADKNEDSKETCEPLTTRLTAMKTGKKAWDKCIEYQEQLIYPCKKELLSGGTIRANHCPRQSDFLIRGSVVYPGEFPHMVLLGFGSGDAMEWLCAGTLISNRFILTAGHCTFSREFGNVTYAVTGILNKTEIETTSRRYHIRRIINHPEYKPPSRYNDIAVLETEAEMILDQFAIPGCLDVGDPIVDARAIATGWGDLVITSSNADLQQMETLTKLSMEACSQTFPPSRLMKQGFDGNTQTCYAQDAGNEAICLGPSGGPLQVKNSKIYCMYTIVGVTSFGKACGFVGEPGVYTRVAAYTSWIESVVWP